MLVRERLGGRERGDDAATELGGGRVNLLAEALRPTVSPRTLRASEGESVRLSQSLQGARARVYQGLGCA